jgi:hypothetical protein
MFRHPMEAYFHQYYAPQPRPAADSTINQLAANAIRTVVKDLLAAEVAYGAPNGHAIKKLKDIADAVESNEFSDLAELKSRTKHERDNLRRLSDEYNEQCKKLNEAHQKQAALRQQMPEFKILSNNPADYVTPVDVTVRFSATRGNVKDVRDFLRHHGPAAFHSLPVKDFKVVSAKRAQATTKKNPSK